MGMVSFETSMSYHQLIADIESVVAMSGEGVNENINKIRELERIKYPVSKMLVETETLLMSKRVLALEDILACDKYKRVIGSSTMLNMIIDSKVATDQGEYRMLQEMIRNIRGSIDSTRSILSAEKKLSEISNYGEQP